MEWDDIVYLSLLIFSIVFGYFYKQIKDPEQKKLIGTGTGLLIVVIVSGAHIIHPIICTLLNIGIILLLPKRFCHLISFLFTFLYLVFFRTTTYFGIPYPPAHTNLVQMMLTLKLVGLAFEVNAAHTAKKGELSQEEIEHLQIQPNAVDIFHYAFNYVGVLTGPYYKYRTFYDYINTPFATHADTKKATINKLKWVPLFAVLFLLITSTWPVSFIHTDEFYNDRSWLYRFWYITPTFAWFRMRIYIGLTLSECVCTMAGLGAYPKILSSKPGNGPTTNFGELKKLKQVQEQVEVECDFNTIYNINPYGSDFCVTFREGMKHWNMCIQYWLAVYVYKRFPSKTYRTFATTFVSAVWHGVYLGYYYCILGVPFYLILEDQFMKVFRKDATGMKATVMDHLIRISKMQAFAYLGFAFHLLTVEKVFKYYNSIYHVGEIWVVIFYAFIMVYKTRKPKRE